MKKMAQSRFKDLRNSLSDGELFLFLRNSRTADAKTTSTKSEQSKDEAQAALFIRLIYIQGENVKGQFS